MNVCAIGLIAFLTTWFALSVLNQAGRSRVSRLHRADPFLLLPLWNFFAPNPGTHDYYLLYRDRNETGDLGGWQLVWPTHYRGWISCFWNPDKLEGKVLADVVGMFAGSDELRAINGPALMLTLPYLVCLKMAIEARPPREGTVRQFVVARKKGLMTDDDLLPILVSGFHST
jgi:hypothetical protein